MGFLALDLAWDRMHVWGLRALIKARSLGSTSDKDTVELRPHAQFMT